MSSRKNMAGRRIGGLDNFSSNNVDPDSVCGVCKEVYNSHIHLPKILSCSHTFCVDCLNSLAKKFEIHCPLLGCKYVTSIKDSGVTGLKTNRAKLGQISPPVSESVNYLNNDNHNPSFEQEVCCTCWRIPPNKVICSGQNHNIVKGSDAAKILKPHFHNILEFSVNSLRNVMALQASLKERMQYTLHSLNKFAEELKLKIEGEELEQKMQQSLLVDLHEMDSSINNETDINELVHKYNKVSMTSQNIASKYKHCYAKDNVNVGLQSFVLELKESFYESYLKEVGFLRSEPFSLASTLKENADKGNFANVLLIYLLSDLLFTRYRPESVPMQHITSLSHSHSFRHTPTPPPPVSTFHNLDFGTELRKSVTPVQSEVFNINSMLEVTNAIESNIISPVSYNESEDPLFSSIPTTPTPEIPNDTLIESNNESENSRKENSQNDLVPLSYLDAVKKPNTKKAAKQSNSDEDNRRQVIKTSSSLKSTHKFPHCWMVVSLNGVRVGRIVFQLRPDVAPGMCDNFVGLCSGRSGYGYKGTRFFKSGDGFLVGGDVENDDGTGGYSVYNKEKFEADLCPLKDDVAMIRFKGIGTSEGGRGMVGSQFMIWFAEREFKRFSFSLVFGKVVDGLSVVQEVAGYNLNRALAKIEECGAI